MTFTSQLLILKCDYSLTRNPDMWSTESTVSGSRKATEATKLNKQKIFALDKVNVGP